MQYRTSKELNVKVYHIPQQVVTTGNPVIMIKSLVAIDLHKIMCCSQLTVEIVSSNLYHPILCMSQTLSSTLDDGKNLGTSLIKGFLKDFKHILLQFVNLVEDRSTVLNIGIGNAVFKFLNLSTQLAGRTLDTLFYLLGTGTQFIVVECLNLRV